MKKILFTCIFIIIILFSLLYPTQIIDASKSGILIWFEQILPALLPFTILSTLLLKSNFLKSFSKGGNLLAICITMCCGFIFGFPIGAKLASDFYKSNLLSERQAIILSITSNNFSPMYVCGFVLPTLFTMEKITVGKYVQSTYVILYLLPLCMAACILIILSNKRLSHTKNNFMPGNNIKTFHLNMPLLDDSIINGFQTLIKLCGYIVLFSILARITTILSSNSSKVITMFIANLEITNGVQILSNYGLSTTITYILAIQLLSFGGLSGIVQTSSIFGSSGLSIYKYIIGKVTLSLLLTLLTLIYVSCFIH